MATPTKKKQPGLPSYNVPTPAGYNGMQTYQNYMKNAGGGELLGKVQPRMPAPQPQRGLPPMTGGSFAQTLGQSMGNMASRAGGLLGGMAQGMANYAGPRPQSPAMPYYSAPDPAITPASATQAVPPPGQPGFSENVYQQMGNMASVPSLVPPTQAQAGILGQTLGTARGLPQSPEVARQQSMGGTPNAMRSTYPQFNPNAFDPNTGLTAAQAFGLPSPEETQQFQAWKQSQLDNATQYQKDRARMQADATVNRTGVETEAEAQGIVAGGVRPSNWNERNYQDLRSAGQGIQTAQAMQDAISRSQGGQVMVDGEQFTRSPGLPTMYGASEANTGRLNTGPQLATGLRSGADRRAQEEAQYQANRASAAQAQQALMSDPTKSYYAGGGLPQVTGADLDRAAKQNNAREDREGNNVADAGRQRREGKVAAGAAANYARSRGLPIGVATAGIQGIAALRENPNAVLTPEQRQGMGLRPLPEPTLNPAFVTYENARQAYLQAGNDPKAMDTALGPAPPVYMNPSMTNNTGGLPQPQPTDTDTPEVVEQVAAGNTAAADMERKKVVAASTARARVKPGYAATLDVAIEAGNVKAIENLLRDSGVPDDEAIQIARDITGNKRISPENPYGSQFGQGGLFGNIGSGDYASGGLQPF